MSRFRFWLAARNRQDWQENGDRLKSYEPVGVGLEA